MVYEKQKWKHRYKKQQQPGKLLLQFAWLKKLMLYAVADSMQREDKCVLQAVRLHITFLLLPCGKL